MLSPADVTALYTTTSAVHDVSAQMSNITPTPLGTPEQHRPPGESAVRTYAVAYDWAIGAQRMFIDDTLKAISVTDNDGRFVLLFEDPEPSGITGLIVPSRLSERAQLLASYPNGSIAQAGTVFEPRADERPQYVTAGVAFDSNGSVTLPAGGGGNAVAVLTTAGTISGTARRVGYTALGAAGSTYTIAGGAQGYILRVQATGRN